MRILVINSGSSSMKYTLFEMEDERPLIYGTIERIGLDGASHSFNSGDGPETTREVSMPDHGAALDEIFSTLASSDLGSLDNIAAVAHRVGHGGKYWDAARINDDVMSEIRRMTPMIPLHHPAMIKEIEECQSRMPGAVHVAVFDSWFHQTIPAKAAIYGLPYRYYEKGYRRTGFHGNSHAYVAIKAAEYVGSAIESLKIITCHLGGGASLCAIDGGKSIDTTLGMTAVEGLMMETRSGDVDPGLLPVIMKEESMTPDRMIDMLYRESGLAGISGAGRDMRDVEAAASAGNERAALAVEAFCYRVKRGIGSMLMVLGGCDILVFAGGIGRNSASVRSKVLEGVAGLGFILDETRNRGIVRATAANPVVKISADSSPTTIVAVRTYEELMMARQCVKALEAPAA